MQKKNETQNKKWLTVLVAFVVSVGLWLYVVTIENPSKDLTITNVPVKFTNVDILRENGLLISDSNVVDGVSLRFVGRLSDLNKLKQSEAEIEVVVDVAHFTRAQEYKISYSLANVVLPSSVSSRDFVLDLQSPYDIKIETSKLASKKIEVLLDHDIKTKTNFTVGEIKQNYQEISIEGPVDVIDQISHAQAVLQRENVDTTIDTELPLNIINKKGEIVDIEESAITISASTVEVEVPIKTLKVVKIEPVFEYGEGVTDADVTFTVEPSEIELAGDASVLDGIDKIQLPAIKTARLLTNQESVTLDIPIPEGCEVTQIGVNGSQGTDSETATAPTANVNVTINNKEITTITIPSEKFRYTVYDGSTVTFLTKELNVIIRANAQDIDSITADNIVVSIDLNQKAEVEGNTRSLTAKVTVEGFEGAGVITSSDDGYSVLLSVE